MSEYPDHLNPFKDSDKTKLGRTLSRSFRGLKGFIRQSFRKKKSKGGKHYEVEDVEVRKTQGVASVNTLRNNVFSLPSPPTYSSHTLTSPPLPRSRFKERLSRSSLNNTYNSYYDERCNPFTEDEGLNPFEEPPVPYRRRKSKKRAPIPPSCSNPDVNLSYGINRSSKWSLTSSETDYTIDDKSECSGDVTFSQSLRECLDNFNKEMDLLNKESIELGGSSPNILERGRGQQIDEHVAKSRSIDTMNIETTREINNNEPDDIISEVLETERISKVNGKVDNNSTEKKIEDINCEENSDPARNKSELNLKYDEKQMEKDFVLETKENREGLVYIKYETVAEVGKVTDSEKEIETENTVIHGTLSIYPISETEETYEENNEFPLEKEKMKFIDEENQSPYLVEEISTEDDACCFSNSAQS